MPEYIITSIVPVDLPELIRCRDCAKNGTINCAMADGNMDGEVVSWNEPDDHCSWAERKGNE